MAMSTRDHNKLLGVLVTIRGCLLLIGGIFLSIFMGGGGMFVRTFGHHHDDHVAGGMMMAGAVVGGMVMVMAGLFDIYTGTKVRQIAPIGRTLGIIVCVMALFSFPLGTALGIYGLWFFLSDAGRELYSGPGDAPVDFDRPQPPPNSWA
ncbi:MAG: hypothetical protein JO314_03545 [Acidobacteria bacterium]|nr:hypothetical protein [Acidobacteriota bacterium]